MFIGVVEDVMDPLEMGRVRVRILGDHTEDKVAIPTDSLPWATVMLPTTSPSISGLGHNPFFVQGSWVVGFYTDPDKQSPIVMGTIPGYPEEKRETTKGFTDPNGVYPSWTNDSDTSYSARFSTFEQTVAYGVKSDKRQVNIQTASPPRVSTVAADKEDAYYEEVEWSEVSPHDFHIPFNPFNHVYQTEAGHIQEFDDTEDGVRYHRFHPSGTYEEIYNEGDRSLKIVGHDYEIILDGKDLYVDGPINITCTGDMRHLVGGNYHLEVEGDYTLDIKGSVQTKITGNDEKEVFRNRSVNIGIDDNLFVGGSKITSILKNNTQTIGIDQTVTVSGSDKITVIGNKSAMVLGNLTQTNIGTLTTTSNGNILFDTPSSMVLAIDADLFENIGGNQSTQVTGNIDIDAARIDFN